MTLTQSIEKGIASATYNPEAEKAMQEEQKKASKAKQAYRDSLFKLRDTKTDLVRDKKASDFYIKQTDALANEGFAWLTANPDADSTQITDQSNLTAERYEDISKANTVILGLSVLPKYYISSASDAFLSKQITEQTKQRIDTFADSISAWLKTSSTLSSEAIFSKQQEFEATAKDVFEGTEISPKFVTSAEGAAVVQKEAQATEVKVKRQEEAEKNTFKFSRLLSETGRITVKVVGSLFIVMLILVSGMLAANDAIGRDPQYRIFYFIYGGLGFPIMLLYYLYRWFSGTGPHIYKLLPLYSQPADTSLMRFLLYPFTYVEDQSAIDAKTDFLTAAATLVGKTYTAPAKVLSETIDSVGSAATSGATGATDLFLQGIKNLSLNTGGVKKATNTILQGIETLTLGR